MKVIYMIAVLMLTIASVVSNESKDFCEEYRKNDYKIGFAMSLYKEYGYDEDMILLFIGNTYWKLSNKRDTVVTIDTLSAGTSNWLSSDKYAMAWPHIHKQYYNKDNCLYGALQKDMHTIDWANTLCNDMNVITEWINSTTNITFSDNNFKPDFVWFLIDFKGYLIFANNENHIIYISYRYIYSVEVVLNSFRENNWKYDHNNSIIAISQQFIDNILQSIIFMSDNKTIQYCYVMFDSSSPFCKPEDFKTMIDCSPQIKQSMISIMIAVIVRVLAVVNFIGALILY
ncbi:uncharacterized protein LOC128962812 [Oppia nitens]|uniref:uncharacterized protein LOC128962812 n=1 Tax=Oppia nitens TaxID=1686743 RepID=UPI0023DA0FC6|nr:uncharacterized protein LOC128962812 [Oppia nitens]